jgi:hypothetical protein
MRYRVKIWNKIHNSISTEASSLREVKSLISGVNGDDVIDIAIKDCKTGAYILRSNIKFWMDSSFSRYYYEDRHYAKNQLAIGIYKSGFIKA